MKLHADIQFKDHQFWIEGKPVINHHYMVQIMNKHFGEHGFSESKGYTICKLHWVPDGDFIFVVTDEVDRWTPPGSCHCGVPNEVHGTCCGWDNARHTCDESGIIRDDRHPFYRKHINEWLNSRFKN